MFIPNIGHLYASKIFTGFIVIFAMFPSYLLAYHIFFLSSKFFREKRWKFEIVRFTLLFLKIGLKRGDTKKIARAKIDKL